MRLASVRASVAMAIAYGSTWLSPGAAAACAVCGSSQSKENQVAYLVTTGFLTVLPLALVGAVVWWLRKRSRELDAEAASAYPVAGTGVAGPTGLRVLPSDELEP